MDIEKYREAVHQLALKYTEYKPSDNVKLFIFGTTVQLSTDLTVRQKRASLVLNPNKIP